MASLDLESGSFVGFRRRASRRLSSRVQVNGLTFWFYNESMRESARSNRGEARRAALCVGRLSHAHRRGI